MASTAVRIDRWRERGSPVTVGLPGSGAVGGIPILQDLFGDNLHLVVEIAWGANLTADSSTWLWTDVTTDVQTENGSKGVAITPGRADEASLAQPATMNLTLDNRTSTYSKSPLAPNWPNVRKNTPVRVRAVYLGVTYTRFFGYATSFQPNWDTTGRYATVDLTANGTLRRLEQGKEALRSPLERGIAARNPVAYWPMEDGASSTVFYSPVSGVAPMSFNNMTPGAAAGPASSSALPTYDSTGTGHFTGYVPPYAATQFFEVNWVQNITQQSTAGSVMLVDTPNGTFQTWEVVAQATGTGTGTVGLNVYQSGIGKTVLFSGIAFGAEFYGSWCFCKLIVTEVAGTVTWVFDSFQIMPTALAGGFETGTFAGTAGVVAQVLSIPSAALNGSLGHVGVFNTAHSNYDNALFGYAGKETAVQQITRLSTEQGENVTIIGNGLANPAPGPQQIDTYTNLIRSCEAVDQGFLFDGFAQGLSYIARDARENPPVTLTLNASAQDLTPPFKPVDDDLLLLNKFTATRLGGATQTFQDSSDALGTNTIGTYDSSQTFDSFTDASVLDYASWKVHLQGTTDTYRYPSLSLSIHRRPALLTSWLSTPLMSGISVINIEQALSQMPPDPIRTILQGYTETITKFMWEVVANGAPYDPWMVTVLAADTGDTGGFLCRLDTDGCHVVGAYPAGSTSLSVVTPSGPLWTTLADDFPLYVLIGGLKIAVNGIASPNVSNGTFESGIAPWTASGGTVVQSSTQKHSGSFSAKLTPDGVSSLTYIFSELVAVQALQPYTVTAWVWFTSTVTANYSISVNWFDATSTYISTSNVLVSVAAGTWTQVTNTFTAPAGAAFASLVPTLSGTPAAAQIWYVDDVSMTGLTHQIFAVDGTTVLKQVNNGDAVTVWDETVLGL